MKCELCGKRFFEGQLAIPVGEYRNFNWGVSEIVPRSRGAHLSCLQEILLAVRALTEESLSHRVEEDGSSDPEST